MGRKKRVNGEMTNAEIYKNWKEAASPTKQLRILADINETTVATIQHIIDEERVKEEAKRQNIKAPEPVEPVTEQPEPVEPVAEQPKPAETVAEQSKPAEHPKKRKPRLTKEKVDTIANLYIEGLNVEQIAERVGVGRSTASRYLRKLREDGKLQLIAIPAKQGCSNMCGWTDRLREIARDTEGYEKTVMILGNEDHASVKFKAGGVTYRLSIERLEDEKNPAE